MTHDTSSRVVLVGGLVWLGAAVAAGLTGVLAALPPPAPQLVILALTIAAIAASVRVPSVRAWADGLSLRTLVAVHAVRFVGAVFLILSARGVISPVFAERAGWGDIATAAGAIALVAMGPPRTSARRWTYLAWNTFGVLDLGTFAANKKADA